MPVVINGTTGISGVDGSAGTPSYQGTDTNTGIFYPAADTIAFAEGGVEIARFDSSGNFGIGTNSPTAKLHIFSSSTGTSGRFQSSASGSYINFVNNSNGGVYIGSEGSAAYFETNGAERMRITANGNVLVGGTTSTDVVGSQIQSGNTSAASAGFQVLTSTTGTGGLYYGDSTTGGARYQGYIEYVHSSDAMTFGTNIAERMRITSGGYTKMSNNGTYVSSTGSYHEAISNFDNSTLIVRNSNGTLTAGGVLYIDANRNTTNNTFYALSYYNNGAGAYKFIVADSGNVTNTNGTYGTISDVKNKENIVDATPKLDKVNQLKVRNFNFKGDDLKQIGFIAQEFEQVFPSMVEEHKDTDAEGNDLGTTTKSIKTSVLVPILVKAIQEQQAMIEELKAKVATLEAK